MKRLFSIIRSYFHKHSFIDKGYDIGTYGDLHSQFTSAIFYECKCGARKVRYFSPYGEAKEANTERALSRGIEWLNYENEGNFRGGQVEQPKKKVIKDNVVKLQLVKDKDE